MDKRRHQRIEVPQLVANVSDGIGSFSGTVGNVSRYGMLLDEIPENFNEQATTLSIVISVNGINFKKMRGIPRWVSGTEPRKKMGVHIPDASSSWTVFVKNIQSKQTKIWAATAHK
jgi:hypothetical protein